MTEQQLFEGKGCPVRQKFDGPRDKWVKDMMDARENYLRTQQIDRQARESAFVDAHEQGLHTL